MASDPTPVRKRWVPGEKADYKSKFIEAVAWLKANDQGTFPAEDPRSFLTWKKFVDIHASSCKHGTWFILPWHRLYLLYFENACRYALQDKNFALPYWDWSQDRKIPIEFFEQNVLATKRGMSPTDEISSEFTDPKIIKNIIESDNWVSMHSSPPGGRGFMGVSLGLGAFESGPHNGVHTQVGGIMADSALAPEDPIFWLHHSNVDRLWADWQHRFPSKILPNLSDESITGPRLPPGGPGRPGRPGRLQSMEQKKVDPWDTALLELRFGDDYKRALIADLKSTDSVRAVASQSKVQDILNIQILNYSYDSVASIVKGPTASHSGRRVPIVPKALVMNILPSKAEAKASSLVSVVDLKAAPSSQIVKALIDSNEAQATLQVSGLQPPADQATRRALRLRFFIVSASSRPIKAEYFSESAFSLPEFVGTYTFFSQNHKHGDAESSPEQNIVLDVTSVLRDILHNRDLPALTLIAVAVGSQADLSSTFKGGLLEIGVHLPPNLSL
jgi:hypothetical protein